MTVRHTGFVGDNTNKGETCYGGQGEVAVWLWFMAEFPPLLVLSPKNDDAVVMSIICILLFPAIL